MIASTMLRRSAAIAITLGAIALTATFGSAAEPRFLPDDPIRVDRDTQNATTKPLEMSLFVDFVYNVIVGRQPVSAGRAGNLNTVEEVPDSSWFTNRVGAAALRPEDVAIGPDTTSGPAPGTWTITASKSDGITPGFTIKDAAGQRWFLKFDPPGYRGMATGTEVVVTKLMWALGYNVPENHVAYLRPGQLVVGSTARFTPAGGRPRAMRASDVAQLLKRADREPDGSYRIVASKALEGTPIGRIRFDGTRPDDPNDVVPHEDRRELRAYGTFAAWLNHVDAKSINSLDTLVTGHGRSFVRHHLIDFGSALGSGGVEPAEYWAGAQYVIEGKPVLHQMLGAGFTAPSYRRIAFFESPAIGRLPMDNTAFAPDAWKPRIPNPAFLHARLDDKFWAAQRLAALSTDLLRAAVKTGEFHDARAEAFLVQALAERRDAILRTYLPALNPISDPRIDDHAVLAFRNAAVDADVARAPRGYRARWSSFDNATGQATDLATTSSRTTLMSVPGNVPTAEGTYVMVDLSAEASEHPAWQAPVRAFFRRHDQAWSLVGFERLPQPTAPVPSSGVNAE